MRILPILFMLLAVFRADTSQAQDESDAHSPHQLLTNTTNFAPPPGLEEYDNIPPGILLTEERPPEEEAGDSMQFGTDIMTMSEILRAYNGGRYDVVVKHLLPMAQNDYAQAQELLGIMYAKGQGVSQNNAAAVEWLTKAAEDGRPLAEHYLATLLYAGGEGVTQDNVTALMWLYIASVHYTEGADKARALQDRTNLAGRLSRRDRLRAFEMARDWLKKRDEAALLEEDAAEAK